MPNLTPRVLTAAGLLLLVLLVLLGHLLQPRTTPLPVYYASPTGSGDGSSAASPMRVEQFWAKAQPGSTLVLLDGTYGGIQPPAGLSGTASARLTIRAQHEGAVLVDAAHASFAVLLDTGSDYWDIVGLNARYGREALYRVKGSHNRLIRVLGWEGTAGMDDSNVFQFQGPGVDNRCIQCGGWGINVRKVWESSQSTAPGQAQQWSSCEQCWLEWNGHPGGTSRPNDTAQLGYRSRQQRITNSLLTMNVLGPVGEMEGVLTSFFDCERADNSYNGTQLLGSFLYVPAAHTYPAGSVMGAWCQSDFHVRDVLALVEGHPSVKPYWFGRLTTYAESGNTCTNCVGVHAGSPSGVDPGTGWTFTPALREGRSWTEALGGQSPYTALPGLCYRYDNGQVTSEGLWPWAMNQRIKQARAESGYPVVDVDAEITRLLGAPPAQCVRGSTPIPPEPPTPGVAALTCTGEIATVPGPLQLRCVPEDIKRRR